MNKEIEELRIDLAELARQKERNRQERLAYVDFKARWLREHAVIPPGRKD